jgi:hypothetical protein
MKVKHLDELYTWQQIRKLQRIYKFNRHNGFVPIAIYSSSGEESYYSSRGDYYEWFGKQTPYYARMLWETARKRLLEFEGDALAFDIVEASECFNTIRFRAPDKVRKYCAEFRRIMRSLADNGEVKCVIGSLPPRPHPWDTSRQIVENVIPDEKDIYENMFCEDLSDCQETIPLIPEYQETVSPGWNAVKDLFIELTEDELAFLNGGKFINKPSAQLEKELQDACRNLDLSKVISLLESGANPNVILDEPYYDTLLTDLFRYLNGLQLSGFKFEDVCNIIDALVLHGYDLDFSPYESGTALFYSVCHNTEVMKYLIEKGANLNSVSWIGVGQWPCTPLDHLELEIDSKWKDVELKKRFNILKNAGAKSFEELVQNFYNDSP